jgi:hypothetical protein
MSTSDKIQKTIHNAVSNVKDATSETLHRGAAESEKARREVAGDTMTTKEKAGSMAEEAKDRIEGGIDHAKQAVRKNT